VTPPVSRLFVLPKAFVPSAFWDALADRPIPWITRDRDRIPAPRRTLGPRDAGRHGAPQHALHPVHAILNVCFTSALTEAVIACHAVALNPGLGVLHLDRGDRPSLACDLIEPVRPVIVAHVLETLARRPLRLADLALRPDGTVRLRPAVLAA